MNTTLFADDMVEIHGAAIRALDKKCGHYAWHGREALRLLFGHPEAQIRRSADGVIFVCELTLNETATAVAAATKSEIGIPLPEDLPVWEKYHSSARFFELDNRGTSWDPHGMNKGAHVDGSEGPPADGAYVLGSNWVSGVELPGREKLYPYHYGSFSNSNNFGYSWIFPTPFPDKNLFAPDSTSFAHFVFITLPFSYRDFDEAAKTVALERQVAQGRESLQTAAGRGNGHESVNFVCTICGTRKSYTFYPASHGETPQFQWPEKFSASGCGCRNGSEYATLEPLLAQLRADAEAGAIQPVKKDGWTWLGGY